MKKIYAYIFFLWNFCHDLLAGGFIYVSGRSSKNDSVAYTRMQMLNEPDLSFRDIDPWLELVAGKHALDYGCGHGHSSRILADKGFIVTGVDINPHMIELAKQKNNNIELLTIEPMQLPFASKTFDLILSNFVLLELNSLENIQLYLTAAKEVLKDDGYFIAITSSINMHNPNLKSPVMDANFPENRHAKSGDLVRVKLKDIDLTFTDYLWTEQDYRLAFANAGFKICQVHYPLGNENDQFVWGYELYNSPLIMILAAKQGHD